MAAEKRGNAYVVMPLDNVTDSGGMTTSEFAPADTNLKIEESRKDASSNNMGGISIQLRRKTMEDIRGQMTKSNVIITRSRTDVSRYLEVFAAELVGTGVLISIGCASCVVGEKKITDFHSAMTFGFIVSSVIAVFGHISAAHFNPAVTVAFYVLGHISVPMMLVYFLAEVLGAIMGYGLLVLLSPDSWIQADTCVTQPHEMITGFQAAGIEFLATAALIFLVCGLNDPRSAERQDSAPLKFAALLIALSLSVGKYTGASMNPARSLAPAVWTGTWNQQWVYWVAPISAAIVTPLFYNTCFLRRAQS